MPEDQQQSNIQQNPRQAFAGLNLNSVPSQCKNGQLSWAVNAVVESFDGNSVSYQNETANKLCANLPSGFIVIGQKNIIEENLKLFWILNESTGESEIGKIVDCEYSKIINAGCLGFDVNHPILKIVYRKNDCGEIEVFWVDALNRTRYLNLSQLPYLTLKGDNPCDDITTTDIDCNKLNVQPNFSIPQIDIVDIKNEGDLTAGTYQFSIQYADNNGEGFTSYYSVTNPTPAFDGTKITLDFNYNVGRAIVLSISNLDTTGIFTKFNLAVIKTVNNISSPELVGTYDITAANKLITYTGQGKTDIKLSIEDIFAKYDVYDTADDITTAQDVLILKGLTTHQRISYQEIANKISIKWQTWRMPKDSFKDPLVSTYLRGYMGDEVYPFEICFLLKNGVQTDGFHIPGRAALPEELEVICGNDVIDTTVTDCEEPNTCAPRWQVYNTAVLLGYEQIYLDFLNGINDCPPPPPIESGTPYAPIPPPCNADPTKPECYSGPFQYGDMAYWESTDRYPCNDIYGDLQNLPIRHHKFPDSLTAHIHDNEGFIYSKGIRIDIQEIVTLINNSSLTTEEKDMIAGFKILRGNRANSKSVVAKGLLHNVGKYNRDNQAYYYPNYPYNDLRIDPFLATTETVDDSGYNEDVRLKGFETNESKQRFTFHSPDTSFYQPYLGNILKLETAEYGESKGHFQLVEKHSRYKFLTTASYASAVAIAVAVGLASNMVGTTTTVFNGVAAFTAMQTMLDIIEKLTPYKNFAYQYNSIGNYDKYKSIPNNGNKQGKIDVGVYLAPGIFEIGDTHDINNYQRESSIYLKTDKIFPFVHTTPGVPEDQSRYLNSFVGCGNDITLTPISSYYGSVKKYIPNQYGQLYSYKTLDTGYQFLIDRRRAYPEKERWLSVYGGDIFINRFGYKSKLPFFIDNRVGFPDGADVEYKEIPNIAHPIFWLSTDSVEEDVDGFWNIFGNVINGLFGRKINNFDCRHNTGGEDKFFYQVGKFYLFAYGIPYFYTESEVNVDERQAFNDKEGDFYPRMSSGIPDKWLQEINTTIQQDNTYYYNKTYSKQNTENHFAHLPDDWDIDVCYKTIYPFRAIFSEDWFTFKPSAKFDFPQNYGKLVSIDGIENQQVLARFEQKPLLYNAMLTAPTSQADIYLGQSLFNQQVPPLDYADTDLGFMGTQHKFLLKTQHGAITVDAAGGMVFLVAGNKRRELTEDNETQQVSKWFMEFLPFQIAKINPDIDNHYKGTGLTGVHDTKYDRLILTKLDYKPLYNDITYINGKYYRGTQEIQLTDGNYFCNYSFTASYSFTSQTWVSLHTYIPNYYIGGNNIFHAGLNSDSSSLWEHNTTINKFNNFFGTIHPYILEYPYSRQYNDEILQNIKDYSRILKYNDWREFIETDDQYFNKLIIYSNQQCSGVLELVPKPLHSLKDYGKYPIYNTDSKTITYTKSNSFYQINTFWDMVVDTKQPIWSKSCESLSIFKSLNQVNMDYGKRSRKKSPIRSKELKIRFILDDKDDIKIITGFTTTPSQISFK